ncbi:MAG: lysophospholipid acyltransferase family protein [Patescibacteria group bacterium]
MAYQLMRYIFDPLLKKRVTASGTEHVPQSGPVLFVANHVGWHDPALLFRTLIVASGYRRIHSVTDWNIFRYEPIRSWVGAIPLHADRSRTFNKARQCLIEGKPFVIYPEGGINESDTIHSVKSGAARLALETHSPVIPAGIRNRSAVPRTRCRRLLGILTGRVEVRIGEPIPLGQWYGSAMTGQNIRNVTDAIMERVAELAGKQYKPL